MDHAERQVHRRLPQLMLCTTGYTFLHSFCPRQMLDCVDSLGTILSRLDVRLSRSLIARSEGESPGPSFQQGLPRRVAGDREESHISTPALTLKGPKIGTAMLNHVRGLLVNAKESKLLPGEGSPPAQIPQSSVSVRAFPLLGEAIIGRSGRYGSRSRC